MTKNVQKNSSSTCANLSFRKFTQVQKKWQTWVNSNLHKFKIEIFGAKIIFKYVSIGLEPIKEID